MRKKNVKGRGSREMWGPRFVRARLTLVSAIAGLLGFAGATRAAAGPLAVDEAPHLRLVYEPVTQGYLTPHVTRCFENALRFHRRLFAYEPSERITVILNDLSDQGHGAAFATPRDGLLLSIAPIDYSFETYPANERVNTMMNHELVHVAALDQSAGADSFFRSLFRGKVQERADHPESIVWSYLTVPRRACPRWYHEGIAVFVETWMAGGIGRAQGAYDEMVFRSMVRDSARFYDPLGLVSEGTKVDFQAGANAYLYGTRFMSWVALEYSPEQLVDWVRRSKGSKARYGPQFENVFDLPLVEAWERWVEWEHLFQRANLDSIRLYPTTPFRDLSRVALGSVSRAFLDPETRELYVAVNYPGTLSHVAALSLESGELRRIRDVKGPAMYTVTSLAWDPEKRTLFYTTDNDGWRDVCSLDPRTGAQRVLVKDLRVGDLVVRAGDRSLFGIRHFDGISTLVRIPPPYDQWEQVYSWPYGTDVYDIDVSPDGRLLSGTVASISGRQQLCVFPIDSLAAGRPTAIASRGFGSSIPSNFVFSADGRFLWGSSYYTGASNLFRYDLEKDSLDAVTNCETGFFRPLPLGQDSLLAFRYTGEGFVPAVLAARPLTDVSAITFLGERIVAKHPVLKDWRIGSPAKIDLDSLGVVTKDYRVFRSMGLASVYPIVEGYKDYAAMGLFAEMSDPVMLNDANLAVTYSPQAGIDANERWHVAARYRRLGVSGTFRLNSADFYDLFGPTKTSREGYSVGLGWQRSLHYDEPVRLDLSTEASFYGNLDRLPQYQNVAAGSRRMGTASARLSYRDERFSLGAVDYEKGVEAEAFLGGSHVNGTAYPQVRTDAHGGLPVFRHSSVWLRSSVGQAFGNRREPSANFYFGGFGNNWVDHGEIQRYRRYYSFPGATLNEISGHNYGRLLLEWNLPPLRFRRLGTPDFYGTWARASLFAGGLVTDLDRAADRRKLGTVGAQVDLRFVLLSNQNLTLSGGYGHAVEHGADAEDEWMISLRIL